MNWVSIGSDNAVLLSIGPLGTNFSDILIRIQNFSFMKMHLKISSAKRWPFCPGGISYTKSGHRQVWYWLPKPEYSVSSIRTVNTLRLRQNRRHFADDIFKCFFLNENVWIPVKISLKFVPRGPINNNQALVQIMAWRWSGDKPLSEPMMVGLPTHICVTRPQWVNGKSILITRMAEPMVTQFTDA